MEASRKREGKGPFSCHLPKFNTDVVLHIAVGITSPFHRVRSLIQTSHRTLAMLADSKGHLLASWSSQGLRSSRCPSCGLLQGRSAASMCGGVPQDAAAPQACRGSPGPAPAPQPALPLALRDGADPGAAKRAQARRGGAGSQPPGDSPTGDSPAGDNPPVAAPPVPCPRAGTPSVKYRAERAARPAAQGTPPSVRVASGLAPAPRALWCRQPWNL